MSTRVPLIGLSVFLLGAGPIAATHAAKQTTQPEQSSSESAAAPDREKASAPAAEAERLKSTAETTTGQVPDTADRKASSETMPAPAAEAERPKSTAETTTAPVPDTADSKASSETMPAPAGSKGEFITQQEDGQFTSEDLLGNKVVGPDGVDIGGIDSLVLDERGGIIAAVVGVGGFLGIGDKPIALPWHGLDIATDEKGDKTIRASVTRQELEAAPEFLTLAQVRDKERRAVNRAQMDSAAGREPATLPVVPGSQEKPK